MNTTYQVKWPVRPSQRSAVVFYARQIFHLLIYLAFCAVYLQYIRLVEIDDVDRSLATFAGYIFFGVLTLFVIGTIIWKYLIIRSIRLNFEGETLILSEGIFDISENQIHLKRVRDFQVYRTFIQRCLGIGDLSIISIDRTLPRLELRGIPDPAAYKKYLASKVTVRASEVEMFRPDVDSMNMEDGEDFEGDDAELS